MNDSWTERWDERYRQEGFAYGDMPNDFFREELLKLLPGKILLPAEGEGRNAVFAAEKGWNVSAFDISVEGQKKALNFAKSRNVKIDYQVGVLEHLNYKEEGYDAIALIYAHFPARIKSSIHLALDKYLRRGGTVILEAFSKNHLSFKAANEKVGGPKDIDSLFSIEEIKADFGNYNIIHLSEEVIQLNEGAFHIGKGSVIRFVGKKR